MKTVKLGNDVRRVIDSNVAYWIKRGYVLCPKSEWKTLRDGDSKSKSMPEVADVAEIKTAKKDNSRGKDYKRKKHEAAQQK